MTRSRLSLGVAAVLAGTAVLFGVLGFSYNLLLFVAAVPFAAASFLLWGHATGRFRPRRRVGNEAFSWNRAARPGANPGFASGAWRGGPGDARHDGRRDGRRQSAGPDARDGTARLDPVAPTREAASRVLGVDPDADDAAIRRAFRERAQDLHPDAADGDAAAFRRARAAYERLTEGR